MPPNTSDPQRIAYVILFIQNTDKIVLLRGEKKNAPDIRTLIGGKVGPDKDDVDPDYNRHHEIAMPWLTVYREMSEEAGKDVRPKHLKHCLDLVNPAQNRVMHVYQASIDKSDMALFAPPEGQIVQCSLSKLHNNPNENLDCPISPMNMAVLMAYKKTVKDQTIPNKTVPQVVIHEDFPAIPVFQQTIQSLRIARNVKPVIRRKLKQSVQPRF